MIVTATLHDHLSARLQTHRVVVWYDPRATGAAVFDALALPQLTKVDARASVLEARRKADLWWMALPTDSATAVPMLLVYVPWPRSEEYERLVQDPFEGYVTFGTHFGVDPADSVAALARRAMPDKHAEIDRLFAESPDVPLDVLDHLDTSGGYPLCRRAFGTQDSDQLAVRLLADPARVQALLTQPGVQAELTTWLREAFGFAAPADAARLVDAFGRWLLFSELALDAPELLPPGLDKVPRAAKEARAAVYAACERLRGLEDARDAYRELATQVAKDLRLPKPLSQADALGQRFTFAFQDDLALQGLQLLAISGNTLGAREAWSRRTHSVWAKEPGRAALWSLAGHALALIEAVQAWQSRKVAAQRPVRDHVLAYRAEEDGLWLVDRCQRWLEREVGVGDDRELLRPLIDQARKTHRSATGDAQDAFLKAVVREGWPPDGVKQAQTFARTVQPILQEGGRVAYFLLDAMRFEMGRDLAAKLDRLGTVTVDAAATVVPTSTPFGMAALMPGAEVGMSAMVLQDELVPVVAGKALPGVEARKALIQERFGDMAVDARLSTLLECNKAALLATAGRGQLLVVRSDDIDKAGEDLNPGAARRYMSTVLDDVAHLTQRLLAANLGFRRFVYVADHGHVQLTELPAGETVREPPGDWPFKKRRCRLGSASGDIDGVVVVPAAHLGLHGPVPDMAVAKGFKVFAAGTTYFHEGISLQECLVPVVVLEPGTAAAPKAGSDRINISYPRGNRFTSRIVSIRLRLVSILDAELAVQVWAYAAKSERRLGGPADCDARDPATNLITVRRDADVSVPLSLDELTGVDEIEIRAVDAAGLGVVLGTLTLKNGVMD